MSFLILISSCSPIKKAQRKSRKAHKLLKEAGMLAPQIMDTVIITKRDTLVLTKDSLITTVRLRLDTVKVDSLIDELVELRSKGLETKTVTKLIYEEILPDLTYASKDSIRIVVDEKERWLRFGVSINIRDDELVIVTKALDNVDYTIATSTVNVDARKIKGGFWKGLKWGVGLTFLILIVLWFFRGVISTAIKSAMT